MEAQIQKIETGSTNSFEKVLVITIKPLNLSKRVKTFLQKLNSTMEGLGSAAAFAIRN
ncbi:MAG: hypothetical protein IZT56_05620 [Bacteroidetes bacterium]|nr:hypothetical protein [Bacteroidota bacterium]